MLVAYDSHDKHPCLLSKIFPHEKIKGYGKEPMAQRFASKRQMVCGVWQSSRLCFNWELCFVPVGPCFSISQRWNVFLSFFSSFPMVFFLFYFFLPRSSQEFEAIGFPATLSHLRHISHNPASVLPKTRNIGVGSTGSSKGRAFFSLVLSGPIQPPARFVAAGAHMELLARKRVWVPCAPGSTLMRWWSDPRFVLSCWSRCGTKRREASPPRHKKKRFVRAAQVWGKYIYIFFLKTPNFELDPLFVLETPVLVRRWRFPPPLYLWVATSLGKSFGLSLKPWGGIPTSLSISWNKPVARREELKTPGG